MKYVPKEDWKLSPDSVTNIATAAHQLGVHKVQIHRWMRSGKLRWVFIGESPVKPTRVLYKPDVEKLIEERAKLAEMEGTQ